MLYEWLIGIVGLAGLLVGVILTLVFSRVRKRKLLSKGRKNADQARYETQRNYLHSQRLQDVYKLLTNLTATLSYQRVIDKALDYSMSALTSPNDQAADHLVSAVLLFIDEGVGPVLYIAASRRLTRSDLRDTFPASDGILKKTIDEGAPLLTRTISQDPELGRIYAFQSCKSAYCLPLRHGLDTFGVLLYAHPERDYFNIEHREILDIIANQAMVAIQNARLYHDLEQEKERMMETQEDARKKLARDLHDGPTQSVAAIAMRVNFARRLIERDTGAAAQELYKIEDLARRTTKEIRHMLFTLRPLVLESQGLNAALESMAEKMKETFEQNVLIDVDKTVEKEIEMGKQGVIFAIVEEAVNNARKYAQAQHIWIRLKPIQKDIAVLEVQDDGVGFDVDHVDASYESRGSLGMINMRERTDLVNGIIRIDSKVGKGTRIQVVIPLSEEATERLHRGI
jgi:signal transduction histidine kinase